MPLGECDLEDDSSPSRRRTAHPIAVQPGSSGGGGTGGGGGNGHSGLVEGGGEQARAGNRMAMDSSVDSLLLPPQNGVLCPASFWEGLPWDDALEGPQPVHIRIPHVRQSSNWDCGLACIQMVLR
jgi:hypothetical protein